MRGNLRVDPDEALRALLQYAPVSRSDLARQLDISRAAMTTLIQEFGALGIVEDNIPTQTRQGRKAMGVRLQLDAYCVVAVRLNRYAITYRLYDGAGSPLETAETQIDTDVKIGDVIRLLVTGIERLLDVSGKRAFLGIAVSTLGWLFETNGEVRIHTDGFSELGKADIRQELMDAFPEVPVLLEHDAKTSALSEYQDHVKETGTTPRCLLNIVGGIGFGGGIVIDGRIFRGAHGLAGEIGHLGVNFNSNIHTRDVENTDFNGLFEDYASPRALRQHVASRLIDYPQTALHEHSTPGEIYSAYEADDELAVWAINRMCRILAYGLAGLVFLLNPEVIVLGDALTLSPSIHARTREHLADYLPPVLMESLELKVSKRGMDGVLHGSYLLLIQKLLDEGQFYAALRSGCASAGWPEATGPDSVA